MTALTDTDKSKLWMFPFSVPMMTLFLIQLAEVPIQIHWSQQSLYKWRLTVIYMPAQVFSRQQMGGIPHKLQNHIT